MTVDAGTPVVPGAWLAHLAGAASAELEDWGPLAEATGEPMATRGVTLWSSEGSQEGTSGGSSGDQEAGVWECTAGPSYWVQEQHEFVHILSGTLTVTADGGSPVLLRPGDSAVFPRGWRGTWELHETVRKVYVIF
ncbi:cupin domain-containing protein [Trebonia sp.]|uniref:cupin domain-containing protein n=1 Tax=Trebonia sp. TaxID=2767075 RepID=UPI002626BF35|nr:cupin domain-containing protein [Trebonia sp.]